MRNTFIFIALFPFLLQAQPGLRVLQGNWERALAEADSTGKLVLLEFSAKWCAPCRQMESSTLSDPELQRYLNSFFVFYRADADQSNGRYLLQKYQVGGLPTVLFVQPDGSASPPYTGYMTKSELLSAAENAFGGTPLGQVYNLYEQAWKAGPRSPTLASVYFALRKAYGIGNVELLEDFLAGLPTDSLALPLTQKVVASHAEGLSGRAFEYLAAWQTSSNRCAIRLGQLLEEGLREAIRDKREKKLKRVLEAAALAYAAQPDEQAIKTIRMRAVFYLETGQVGDYVAHLQKVVPELLLPRAQEPAFAALLEELAWQHLQFVDVPAALSKAAQWLKAAPSSPQRLGYCAQLSMKAGDKAEALQCLDSAIGLAKQQQEDSTALEQLRAEYALR
jgi:thiol-disulfide isomerase/thioredoxin